MVTLTGSRSFSSPTASISRSWRFCGAAKRVATTRSSPGPALGPRQASGARPTSTPMSATKLGARRQRVAERGRLRLDERARARREVVDRVDRVEAADALGRIAAVADERVGPAEPRHAHDDRHARPRRLPRAQRLGEELHLVEEIEDVGLRPLRPEHPLSHPGPGARPRAARPEAEPGGEPANGRPARVRAEQHADAVHREAAGEGQGIGTQRGEGHPVATRGQPLGDQPHRVLRAADAPAEEGRLLCEEEDVHQGLAGTGVRGRPRAPGHRTGSGGGCQAAAAA